MNKFQFNSQVSQLNVSKNIWSEIPRSVQRRVDFSIEDYTVLLTEFLLSSNPNNIILYSSTPIG